MTLYDDGYYNRHYDRQIMCHLIMTEERSTMQNRIKKEFAFRKLYKEFSVENSFAMRFFQKIPFGNSMR